MPGDLQPLVNNQKIVNPDGTPNDYFIRWAQQRQIDIVDGVPSSRKINTDNGLQGGGDLSTDLTLELTDTGVAPGTYGDATHSAHLTIDAQGRIAVASIIPISGSGGGGWAFSGFGATDFTLVTATATGSFSNDPQDSMGFAPLNSFFWGNSSGQTLTFYFGGSDVIISALGIISDRNGSSQGFWQFEGSEDNIAWTALGVPVEWFGAPKRTLPFGNSTPYKYYRMSQTSGTTDNSQYQSFFVFLWG